MSELKHYDPYNELDLGTGVALACSPAVCRLGTSSGLTCAHKECLIITGRHGLAMRPLYFGDNNMGMKLHERRRCEESNKRSPHHYALYATVWRGMPEFQ